MPVRINKILFLALFSLLFMGAKPDWGFFAHQRINRLAVFTLPPEMMVFYKKHIDYVTEHAVDPDVRRYIFPGEGPRHFIDLDNFAKPSLDHVPRTQMDAMMVYTQVWGVQNNGDSIQLFGEPLYQPHLNERGKLKSLFTINASGDTSFLDVSVYREYFAASVLGRVVDYEADLHTDSLVNFLIAVGKPVKLQGAFIKFTYGEHGALPWSIQELHKRLVNAFKSGDTKSILQKSADLGHYIGDAHVPLHTTSNYNGQKSGQDGIHGFWESRIPELFADETYDYVVGKPEYVENIQDFYWNMVLESNSMVDSVLSFEKHLRQTYPQDHQVCTDLRQGKTIIAPCREFADAYQTALDGMVERRMRAAIHNLSSAWYSAWVDAGKPDLSKLGDLNMTEAEKKEEAAMRKKAAESKVIGKSCD